MPAEAVHANIVRRLVALGLPATRDFLELHGVVVSGHVGRNVSRVELAGETAYLKREHRVRLRDRFRSLLAGFGATSLSEREYQVIRRLRENGLPAPQLLARGEADGQAFLLLAPADGAVDLRRLAPVGPELAADLGRTVALVHEAGVDQPDLFAKHFLVNPETGQVTILDWQRARLRDVVPWRSRVRSLAALRATCPESLLPPASWNVLLATYARAAHELDRCRFGAAVDAAARALAGRPSIRSQLAPPAADQELVRIGGETVCAIPAIADELNPPDVIATLYDPANDGRTFMFRDGRAGVLRVRRYRAPFGRWWAALRGKNWRSHELKAARLLFHLERHGIPAPKLLAYGQTISGSVSAGSFLLSEPPSVRPPRPNDRDEIEALLARLHAAGCSLRAIGPTGEPFGFDGTRAIVTDIRRLRLTRRLSGRRACSELHRLAAFFGGRR
jgi:tRNA A-37 threonylcarbamoyl transferase component Bud32